MGKAYIPVELDKVRNLRYNMRAISLVEETLGKPIAEINLNKLSIKQLATFVWAGLYHEDKDLTPDSVMDLIDEYSDITTVSVAMSKAIQQGFGQSKNG